MNIQKNNQYRISPSHKKCIEEYSFYRNVDLNMSVCHNAVWRGGEYLITPRTDEEVELLIDGNDHGPLEISAFEDFEMLYVDDEVAAEFTYYNIADYSVPVAEDLQEWVENGYQEEGFGWFDEEGFIQMDTETYILDGYNVEMV